MLHPVLFENSERHVDDGFGDSETSSVLEDRKDRDSSAVTENAGDGDAFTYIVDLCGHPKDVGWNPGLFR